MTLPTEGQAGLTTWTEPRTGTSYAVILAPDFGTTKDSLEAWEHYRRELGEVKEVFVTRAGIEGLPYSANDLASFVALGSTGTALALSGVNCGYGGEGPHGTVKILRKLEIGKAMARLVFELERVHFVHLEDGWMAEVEGGEFFQEGKA